MLIENTYVKNAHVNVITWTTEPTNESISTMIELKYMNALKNHEFQVCKLNEIDKLEKTDWRRWIKGKWNEQNDSTECDE